MISFRQSDLLQTLNPVIHCRVKIYNTKSGIYFYDIEPLKSAASDKIKPLQDKIDSVMDADNYMEKVAVGWMSTKRTPYEIELTLAKILQGNSKVKNLREVRLNEDGTAFDFEYHP
jgi:hypothetical protein